MTAAGLLRLHSHFISYFLFFVGRVVHCWDWICVWVRLRVFVWVTTLLLRAHRDDDDASVEKSLRYSSDTDRDRPMWRCDPHTTVTIYGNHSNVIHTVSHLAEYTIVIFDDDVIFSSSISFFFSSHFFISIFFFFCHSSPSAFGEDSRFSIRSLCATAYFCKRCLLGVNMRNLCVRCAGLSD